MHLTDVKVSEDVLLLLGLLSRGYKTRLSSEFLNTNYSINDKEYESVIWSSSKFDDVHRDHKFIQNLFPKYFEILYDHEGKREAGGYRNFGKIKVQWNKAYRDSQQNSHILDELFK